MSLSHEQKDALWRAIRGYSFPPEYFDFTLNRRERLENTRAVESRIKAGLVSGEVDLVKNALSNVLYWGYSQMVGVRDTRVERFRKNTTEKKLLAAARLFHAAVVPSLPEIKDIGLPEFSGMSFISKIRMFLDPVNSATLDRQIMKIHGARSSTILAKMHTYPTQIPITGKNALAYENWCRKMREISTTYFEGEYRVADVERGFFQLIQEDEVALAGDILGDA